MSDLSQEEAIAALRWLVEAGADETTAEQPVNHLIRAQQQAMPETKAANLQQPSPPVPPGPLSPEPSRSVEAAERLAASCHSLADLKSALANFDGCELK